MNGRRRKERDTGAAPLCDGGDGASRARLLAGLSAYLLYFAPGHWQDIKFAWRRRGL